jgi:hypothetical protein
VGEGRKPTLFSASTTGKMEFFVQNAAGGSWNGVLCAVLFPTAHNFPLRTDPVSFTCPTII